MRRLVPVLVLVGALVAPARAAEPITLQATIDTAQEAPAPTGTNAGEGGTATFTFDTDTLALTYDVTLHDVTSDPIAGHIHKGAPGVAGGIEVGLTVIPTANGEAQGSVNLPAGDVQPLFDGGLYINFHTTANIAGEVRGQIRPTGGDCPCAATDFKKCVKAKIKALAKADKKAPGIVLLKRLVRTSACGKPAKKKKVGCCLPGDPIDNIVSDRMCALLPARACTHLQGVSRGTGSSCATACSPSGAFLDDVRF